MKVIAALRVAFALSIVAFIAAGGLAGCVPVPTPGAAATGLTVADAFARPAPSGGNGGAFFTVTNVGPAPDRLIAARSPAAPIVELHETIDDNGVMKMRPVPGGFEVPAKGRLELKPGGKHVMFIGLTSPLLEGQDVEVTLVFEKAGEITVKAPIRM